MRKLVIIFLIFLMSMAWSVFTNAQANCDKEASASVISLQGKVAFDPEANGVWHEAQLNETLCEGTKIWVKPNSRMSLALPGNDVLRLKENTLLTLKIINLNQTSLLDVVKGFIHFISRKPKEVKIESGIANAAPLGTEFAFSVDDNKAALWVYEGGVKFYNQHGSVNLNSGQAAEALLGKAPQLRIDIKPQDAVNWALYYPPLLPQSAELDATEPAIQSAIDDYRKGRIDLALQSLATVPPTQQTAHFHKVRGALRLIVGQVDLAWQDIKALQANKPTDAEALALQSVIALTQNRKDQAYELASKAVYANPQSATAYTALSYAEQGRFNLEKAQAAADKAAELAPQDAMALARKAELQLSQGLISDSEQTVKQAISLDANLERTQTIKGFTHLMNMDTDEAMQAFDKAITLDSTSPLARLGLGLAKIRDGDLEAGRKDLEIAANLDPNNSLIRSYLGKAYYEEKRSDRAEEQFKLAKERDPKDPTPYFYNAIKKQTENRPIEALDDLQNAMELNDNRDVYRSKLLLDKDLAARGSALGRIYNELGFSQRGLVEGWRGVTNDQTDYTSHRLLSDSYSILPRHDLARSSELLQSQLLQPINITPVQPRLAESQLFLLGGLGPSALSLNEFNPLFERDRFSLLASGLVGSNDTYSNETVHSGLWDDFSYSLGQFHYQTSGFRKNNDIDVNVYNAFAQARITPDLSVQAEYRHRDVDRGNLESYYSPTNDDISFINNFRLNAKSDRYRFGIHYIPVSDSDLLGSFIHVDQAFYDDSFVSHADIAEAQYIQRFNNNIYTILGGGYNDLNTSFGNDDRHFNTYLYAQFKYPSTINWTLGLSYAFLDDNQFPKNLSKLYPKFGFLWNITQNTVFRAAIFRTVNRDRYHTQTLEPVQIAGFNQFFDDDYRLEYSRWGIGLDHKVNSNLSVGFEVSKRYLDIHSLSERANGNIADNTTRRQEDNYRAYLFWMPHPRWAGSFEYLRENFHSPDRLAPATQTQVIPIGLSYFHPNGIFAKFKSSFYYQSALVDRGIDSDNAIFLDLALGYRLPQRLGIFEIQFQNLLDQNYRYEGLQQRQPVDVSGVPLFLPFPTELTVSARITLSF